MVCEMNNDHDGFVDDQTPLTKIQTIRTTLVPSHNKLSFYLTLHARSTTFRCAIVMMFLLLYLVQCSLYFFLHDYDP